MYFRGDKVEVINNSKYQHAFALGDVVEVREHTNMPFVECAGVSRFDGKPCKQTVHPLDIRLQESPQKIEGESDAKVVDLINHPPHYCKPGQPETIDKIKTFLSAEEYRGFLKGAALKYIDRYESKGGESSLDKAVWFILKLKEDVYAENPSD